MGQFAAAIRGMAAACRGARLPGRARQCQPLQRDRGPRRSCRRRRSAGSACWRTPRRRSGIALAPWLDLVLIGDTQRLARPVALAARDRRARGGRAAAGGPRGRAAQRRFRARADPAPAGSRACHDVSDGGLLVAIAEMAMAGGVGARLSAGPRDMPGARLLVRRGPGPLRAGGRRCRVAASPPPRPPGVPAIAHRPQRRPGFDTARWRNHIRRERCATAHERFFPAWMDGPSG